MFYNYTLYLTVACACTTDTIINSLPQNKDRIKVKSTYTEQDISTPYFLAVNVTNCNSISQVNGIILYV